MSLSVAETEVQRREVTWPGSHGGKVAELAGWLKGPHSEPGEGWHVLSITQSLTGCSGAIPFSGH